MLIIGFLDETHINRENREDDGGENKKGKQSINQKANGLFFLAVQTPQNRPGENERAHHRGGKNQKRKHQNRRENRVGFVKIKNSRDVKQKGGY